MPLTQLTGTLGIKRAAHLLRRACLGGSKTEIDTFATLTPTEAVQRLFNNELPDPGIPVPNPAAEEENLEQDFLTWHLGQILGNNSNLEEAQKLSYIFRERLVFFFHTHFTTKRSVVRDWKALYYQQALFRLFAFDQEDLTVPPEDPDADPGDPRSMETMAPRNFKQLTKKLCVDNAMLRFLDGRLNVKDRVNENFARELLELYSIGRGLEGNIPPPEFDGDYFVFTEQDVQEGAKVVSGFELFIDFNSLEEAVLDRETGLPRGRVKGINTTIQNEFGEDEIVRLASQHEEGIKTFSARLNNGTVTPNEELQLGGNPTEQSILDEISQFVDLIYEQEQTPIAICREIYRFFVYHEVTPALQESIIQDLADIFIANEFKIQPVLEALFTSTHFYEAEAGAVDNNFGCIIKSPIDLVLGFMRNFEIAFPNYETELELYYAFAENILDEIGNQGMNYYEPFEVAGYSAYHQFPIFNRSWITPNYLANRYGSIRERISDGNVMEMGQVDIVQFVRDNFADVAPNANELMLTVIQYFLPVSDDLSFEDDSSEITVARLNYFKRVFLDNIDEDPEAQWTIRWTTGQDPTTVATQLTNLFNSILQSPEYQLM
ncbi:DUF1800 family protein [Ekhidna sp.]